MLRGFSAAVFIFISAMLIDKYTAVRMPSDHVVDQKPMIWSYSTPGTLEIQTENSVFGVEKKYEEELAPGQEVIVKESPYGKIPVAVFIISEEGEIP